MADPQRVRQGNITRRTATQKKTHVGRSCRKGRAVLHNAQIVGVFHFHMRVGALQHCPVQALEIFHRCVLKRAANRVSNPLRVHHIANADDDTETQTRNTPSATASAPLPRPCRERLQRTEARPQRNRTQQCLRVQVNFTCYNIKTHSTHHLHLSSLYGRAQGLRTLPSRTPAGNAGTLRALSEHAV